MRKIIDSQGSNLVVRSQQNIFGGNQNLVNLKMKLTTSKHIFFRRSNIEKLEKHNFDSKEAYAWHGI
jgi:hypothetical protein